MRAARKLREAGCLFSWRVAESFAEDEGEHRGQADDEYNVVHCSTASTALQISHRVVAVATNSRRG